MREYRPETPCKALSILVYDGGSVESIVLLSSSWLAAENPSRLPVRRHRSSRLPILTASGSRSRGSSAASVSSNGSCSTVIMCSSSIACNTAFHIVTKRSATSVSFTPAVAELRDLGVKMDA